METKNAQICSTPSESDRGGKTVKFRRQRNSSQPGVAPDCDERHQLIRDGDVNDVNADIDVDAMQPEKSLSGSRHRSATLSDVVAGEGRHRQRRRDAAEQQRVDVHARNLGSTGVDSDHIVGHFRNSDGKCSDSQHCRDVVLQVLFASAPVASEEPHLDVRKTGLQRSSGHETEESAAAGITSRVKL